MDFVDITIVEGPDEGMRFTVMADTFRVIGRAGSPAESTVHMTREGDRMLDAEQRALVDRIVTSRASRGRGSHRTRGADILINDESVSRSHAAIFADKKGASVADLTSTNGTKVNGERVSDVDVNIGDVLQVGSTKFKILE